MEEISTGTGSALHVAHGRLAHSCKQEAVHQAVKGERALKASALAMWTCRELAALLKQRMAANADACPDRSKRLRRGVGLPSAEGSVMELATQSSFCMAANAWLSRIKGLSGWLGENAESQQKIIRR